MSIKESMLKVWNKVRQGPVTTEGREANLLNGGHTGYHPPVQPRQQQKKPQLPPLSQSVRQNSKKQLLSRRNSLPRSRISSLPSNPQST